MPEQPTRQHWTDLAASAMATAEELADAANTRVRRPHGNDRDRESALAHAAVGTLHVDLARTYTALALLAPQDTQDAPQGDGRG